MTTWKDPSGSNKLLDSTVGAALTGDPVADRQRSQPLSAHAEITDPDYTAGGEVLSGPPDVLVERSWVRSVVPIGPRCFRARRA
jgi:hypothetical protein